MSDDERPEPAAPATHPTIGATMADSLQSTGKPPAVLLRAAHELDALDQAAYVAVASTPTPTLDATLRRLSRSADHGMLWIGIAGAMALLGGEPGRRAAKRGIAALALSSAVVNLGLKPIFARARPVRATDPSPRFVHMPGSTSFPSGHAASGLAFANAIGTDLPVLALPIRALATAVAYSRVHAGVHYPGDVVAGSMLGAVAGDIVRNVAAHRARTAATALAAAAGAARVGASAPRPT